MIPPQVRRVLERHGLSAIEFEAGSTPTAVLAAEKLGVAVGSIAKSLLLVGKDGSTVMVVCPGDRRLSNPALKRLLGTKTRLATAGETLKVTGFRPGGVCPFGVEGIPIYLDRHLADHPVIYPAAGTDSSGVPTTFEQLREITGAAVCDCTSEPEPDTLPAQA